MKESELGGVGAGADRKARWFEGRVSFRNELQ